MDRMYCIRLSLLKISSNSYAQTYRINCGGSAYTDQAGNAWSADSYYSGGSISTTTSAIAATSDDKLYQSERYGTPVYQFPANGWNTFVFFIEVV